MEEEGVRCRRSGGAWQSAPICNTREDTALHYTDTLAIFALWKHEHIIHYKLYKYFAPLYQCIIASLAASCSPGVEGSIVAISNPGEDTRTLHSKTPEDMHTAQAHQAHQALVQKILNCPI